jgi:exodeoxyribonuclease VII small subunit
VTDPKDAPAVPDPAGFEEALSRLEAIVGALEEGQIPLADALERYAEGIKLLKACYQTLAHAERRIELLNRVDQQGNADSEPFDDSALSLDQKAQSRSRRRTRGADSPSASGQNEIDESGRLF